MNVLFYLDEKALLSNSDSTNYVYSAIKKKYPNTKYSTTENFDIAKDADIIFNRFDVPWNAEFLKKLGTLKDKFQINDPISKINLQSKKYLLNFPELIPPTIYSGNEQEITDFARDMGQTVMKPDDLNMGLGIVKIDSKKYSTQQLKDYVNTYLKEFGPEVIVQRFIPEIINEGDRRLNVINYEVPSGIIRLPKKGSFLANLSAGGSMKKLEITKKETDEVQPLIPFLKEHKLPWVSVDYIGPYLGEINVSSPGMFVRADRLNNNTKGLDAIINMIEKYSS